MTRVTQGHRQWHYSIEHIRYKASFTFIIDPNGPRLFIFEMTDGWHLECAKSENARVQFPAGFRMALAKFRRDILILCGDMTTFWIQDGGRPPCWILFPPSVFRMPDLVQISQTVSENCFMDFQYGGRPPSFIVHACGTIVDSIHMAYRPKPTPCFQKRPTFDLL